MLFSIFKKCISRKTVPIIFRFVSILFSIFENGIRKKPVPVILTFVGMVLFNI